MKKNRKDKAQAMVVSFIYLSVLSLMGIYMMSYAKGLNQLIVREVNYAKALYAGEAALMQSYLQRCNGGATAVSFNIPPMRISVRELDIVGLGYTRLEATVEDWSEI